jgi:TPP-dependent pyruvate/acetoin dehydrogenase alpha subunit
MHACEGCAQNLRVMHRVGAEKDALCGQVVEALSRAQKEPKPPLGEMFTDVYAALPWHLREQQAEALAHARRHPDKLQGVPLE